MTDTSIAIATAETLLMVARVSNAKHDHCRLINEGGDAILSLVAEVERLQAALDKALKGEQESEANLAHALHQLATARADALALAAMRAADIRDNCGLDQDGNPFVSEETHLFAASVADDIVLEILAMKGKP